MATDFTSLLADQVGNEFSASQQYIAVGAWFEQQTLPELAGQEGLRLIHAESDGLPGVIADRYGDR